MQAVFITDLQKQNHPKRWDLLCALYSSVVELGVDCGAPLELVRCGSGLNYWVGTESQG